MNSAEEIQANEEGRQYEVLNPEMVMSTKEAEERETQRDNDFDIEDEDELRQANAVISEVYTEAHGSLNYGRRCTWDDMTMLAVGPQVTMVLLIAAFIIGVIGAGSGAMGRGVYAFIFVFNILLIVVTAAVLVAYSRVSSQLRLLRDINP